MSHHTLIKVYGHIYPASQALLNALTPLAREALPAQEDPILELDGDMLRISFAGVYFPFEDLLKTVHPHLTENSAGKIDHIDLEAWMLHRHVIEGRSIRASRASLNQVLDYSGH